VDDARDQPQQPTDPKPTNGTNRTPGIPPADPPRTKKQIEANRERPKAIPVNFDAIPAELKARTQWVVWRYELRRDSKGQERWTKVPYAPHTLRKAAADDQRTWCFFDKTVAELKKHKAFDGIGFMFAEDDPYCGIDLDDCRDPATGKIAQWAAPILESLASYTEVSPSRAGAKVVVKGRKLGPRCRTPYEGGEIEMYDCERYFALTGHRLDGTPATVEDRQEQLDQLYSKLFPPKQKTHKPGKTAGASAVERNGTGHRDAGTDTIGGGGATNLSDEELLDKARKAKNGAWFTALWDGSTNGYQSHSEADLALCGSLAFWCGPYADRIDRLFRQSGLMRDKWDELRGQETYGEGTIAEALEGRTEFYSPRQKGRRRSKQEPAWSPDSPGPASDASATTEGGETTKLLPSGYEIILAHFQQYYAPTFRRGSSIYSSKLQREVKGSEATWGAPKCLIDRLAGASDAPVNDKTGKVKDPSLPYFFSTWAKSAWVDLLGSLPDEERTEVMDKTAEEQFRQLVSGALHTLVTLGEVRKEGREEVTRTERRSVIDWCFRFAKEGPWKTVRSYKVWCRFHVGPEGQRQLEVALRAELFTQLSYRPLIDLTQTKFASLCGIYNIGTAERAQGVRAVVLTQEFVDGLVADLNQAPKGTDGGTPTPTPSAAPGGLEKEDAKQEQSETTPGG